MWIAIAAGVGILLLGIVTYNSLIKLVHQSNEAYATMDVYLKKRYDLIPNLVEVVKAYAAHEGETLINLTQARSDAMNATDAKERLAAENKLTTRMNGIFAIAENYPDLHSNENFIQLSGQLQEIEGDIANSRKYYNGVVRELNSKIDMFPSNLIAKIFGFAPRDFFALDSAEERENIKVKF